MLSRVAESLHWTARYIERAENVTRLLDVTFHALLDSQTSDREDAWHRLVAMLGSEAEYLEHYDAYAAPAVTDWLLWHDGNPTAVVACVTLARENARAVREQISNEMWEAINNLFLLVRRANRAHVSRGPHAFFEQVRNGSHLFQGTAAATMVRGEPYEFIQLGLHLERAATTVRAIASRYPVAWSLPADDAGRTQQLASLLRSCSAFEPYVKRHGLGFEPVPVAEELIRSLEQPRSVLSCLRACQEAVQRISGTEGMQVRLLGRLCADLEYGELRDPSGPAVREAMDVLLSGIYEVGDAITRAYFSSQAIVVGFGQQEAQQQQCG
jgi:uncharacterized alpha-E superfamily protein